MRPTRWQSPWPTRPANPVWMTRSPFISSIRKAHRSSTFRARADLRSSFSAEVRSSCRPIVLGTGAILLNAADKDDQIEISKIVPSKFGDNDVKLRTSMELGEVVRRMANLGATYPDVVAILEAANRQKNLPGTLVVDAVPTANMDYLAAAILGKDSSKGRSCGQARPPPHRQSRLLRLFGLGDRGEVETAATKSGRSKANDPSKATSDASRGSVQSIRWPGQPGRR